jgi:hypothetical protein
MHSSIWVELAVSYISFAAQREALHHPYPLSSELSEAVLDRDAEGGSILVLENTLFEVTKVEGPAAMENEAAAATTDTMSRVGSTALATTAKAARADVAGLLLLLLAM